MTKNNSTSKSTVACLKVGHASIEVLKLPDGSYAIEDSQAARLFSTPAGDTISDFKELLGKRFQLLEVQLEPNSPPINVLTLAEFDQLVKVLATNGDEHARLFLGYPPKTKIHLLEPPQEVTIPSLRNYPKTKIPPIIWEKDVQLRLQSSIGGIAEVKTRGGTIDLLTDDQIIEVKRVKEWKSALGQILIYGKYYPSHQKRIHLFGESKRSHLLTIRKHCADFNVIVTHQTELKTPPKTKKAPIS